MRTLTLSASVASLAVTAVLLSAAPALAQSQTSDQQNESAQDSGQRGRSYDSASSSNSDSRARNYLRGAQQLAHEANEQEQDEEAPLAVHDSVMRDDEQNEEPDPNE